MNASQQSLKALFESIAKSEVTVEIQGTRVFVFGSELACLRLYAHRSHKYLKNLTCEYSLNLSSWYFAYGE